MNRELQWTKPERQTPKSKVKFNGNFREELEKVITQMEEYFENEFSKEIAIDSVIAGNNEIKIRINDEDKWIQCIINCIFRYHHNEEKHGNINIELGVYEVSKKTKVHFVGTFGIREYSRIKQSILEDINSSLRVLYPFF